jgi:hypothetical protein
MIALDLTSISDVHNSFKYFPARIEMATILIHDYQASDFQLLHRAHALETSLKNLRKDIHVDGVRCLSDAKQAGMAYDIIFSHPDPDVKNHKSCCIDGLINAYRTDKNVCLIVHPASLQRYHPIFKGTGIDVMELPNQTTMHLQAIIGKCLSYFRPQEY